MLRLTVKSTHVNVFRHPVYRSTERLMSIFDTSDYWTSKRHAEWNNVGVVKANGRVNAFNHYPQSWEIIPATVATTFTPIECTNLLSEQQLLPAPAIPARKAKLVVFAFKQYGLGLLPSYYNPFLEKFQHNRDVELIEICFVEHKFLSLAKGLFISGLRSKVPAERHANTGYVFGGVKVCVLIEVI